MLIKTTPAKLRKIMELFNAPFFNVYLAYTAKNLFNTEMALSRADVLIYDENTRRIEEEEDSDYVALPIKYSCFETKQDKDLETGLNSGFLIEWVSRSGKTYTFRRDAYFLHEQTGASIEFPIDSSILKEILSIIEV